MRQLAVAHGHCHECTWQPAQVGAGVGVHAMAAARILDSGALFTVEEARPSLWEGDARILRLLFMTSA